MSAQNAVETESLISKQWKNTSAPFDHAHHPNMQGAILHFPRDLNNRDGDWVSMRAEEYLEYFPLLADGRFSGPWVWQMWKNPPAYILPETIKSAQGAHAPAETPLSLNAIA